MSRTFKTDPYWVKLRHPERSGIHPVARHDHSDTPCNLPSSPTESTYVFGDCYWEWHYTGVNECGCRMCTNYWQRRWDRRRARNYERRVTQKWLDEYEEHSGNCCPVCGDPECQGNGPLEDKWYIGCYA